VSGTLYLVATPIGNLEDITYRAVRILQEVDLIACEDTRHTARLLDHYGIRKPTISYHEHNEHSRSVDLVERLAGGLNIALVTDAGTPLVSDPGYRLVTRAIQEGIAVVPLPGASAAMSALVASGLPTDSFYFGGFLPAKAGQRRHALEAVKELSCSLIFYEAPHRVIEALDDIAAVLGQRRIVMTRELTKIHEEFLRGTPDEVGAALRGRPPVKGEITLVIGKPLAPNVDQQTIPERVQELVNGGVPRMDAMKTVARERGLSKREVYSMLESSDSD
jgi:16S rRNA (cytidine1402-2'-O)-methyltransferase